MVAKPAFKWPDTISEVAQEQTSKERYLSLKDFCNAFYTTPKRDRAKMLVAEPPLTGDEQFDAYIAASAEYLSKYTDAPPPPWTRGAKRFLHMPWFPCRLDSLKAICIAESPAAFRRRMIFVDADPLFRPLKLRMEQ